MRWERTKTYTEQWAHIATTPGAATRTAGGQNVCYQLAIGSTLSTEAIKLSAPPTTSGTRSPATSSAKPSRSTAPSTATCSPADLAGSRARLAVETGPGERHARPGRAKRGPPESGKNPDQRPAADPVLSEPTTVGDCCLYDR